MKQHTESILRHRDGHEAKVFPVELFFDLIYVFCITQLSHRLLHHLDFIGAAQTGLLWGAVWLGWQYTCWVTNWFNPENRKIRIMMFFLMAVGLLLGTAIPEAFGSDGLLFALSYVSIQVGRSLFIVFQLEKNHAISSNFRRILGWTSISATFWISGAFLDGGTRFAFWSVAVLVEYFSPWFGFWLPGLGRSKTTDWTIEGGHLAERCQLFMIVAFGEAILLTGTTLTKLEHWDIPTMSSYVVVFLTTIAMWWIYFDTSSKDGTHAIVKSEDPGRIGAYFHYVHILLVGSIIIAAVAAELILAHPDGKIKTAYAAVLLGGPILYLLGNSIYRNIVYCKLPKASLFGLAAHVILIPISFMTDLLMVGGLSCLILLSVAFLEGSQKKS